MTFLEDEMLNIHVEKIGEMAVVDCEGRMEQGEDSFRLREAVTSQHDVGTIVVDLSEVTAIEGSSIGMLVFLQRWARDYNIRFRLFNPSKFVREQLRKVGSIAEFDIPTLHEMMALLARSHGRFGLAA